MNAGLTLYPPASNPQVVLGEGCTVIGFAKAEAVTVNGVRLSADAHKVTYTGGRVLVWDKAGGLILDAPGKSIDDYPWAQG